ncbi:hypothetical protein AB0I34_28560, partial [Kribbella sp. NPDC050281]|uniref:hypothetical protein n=1 Tax=Kribbella sp. NPDC050281 TaxID=3155515 RepID=UPI00340CE580
ATEVISSDFCRGLVSDDENDQAASKDAFEVLPRPRSSPGRDGPAGEPRKLSAGRRRLSA